MVNTLFLSHILAGLAAPALSQLVRLAPKPSLPPQDDAEDTRTRRDLILEIWDGNSAAFGSEDAQRQTFGYFSRRL